MILGITIFSKMKMCGRKYTWPLEGKNPYATKQMAV